MKKFQTIVWSQIWYDQKQVAQTPLWKIQSRVLGKWKNAEIFFTSNLAWLKKVNARTPLWKIQSLQCSVNEGILKICLVSNLAWPKKVGPDTPLKNLVSTVLGNGKYSKTFLTSNLVWPKILLPWPLLQIIQSPQCSVNEKFLKNFWPQI